MWQVDFFEIVLRLSGEIEKTGHMIKWFMCFAVFCVEGG